MERRNLYEADVHEECRSRIGHLRADSAPVWGSMSAARMLAHCAEVQDVANGKPLVGTPWFVRLLAPFIRRTVVSENPYPKGLRTHPQYVQAAVRDFETERARLLVALEGFRAARHSPGSHPLFGDMTEAERGWASYKHLDHHLRQFGV